MKHLLKSMALIAAVVPGLSACGQSKSSEQNAATSAKNGAKALVVFFSHAGDNYSVGNIKVGNTKLVAQEIQKQTGADLFEIVPEKSYDMAYTPLTQLAKKEQEQGELPAFKGTVPDLKDYSVVFVGGPVWWGTYPQVMFTFFNQADLNGKTIYPFTTHEGSGLGRTVQDLKQLYPKADVKDGFSLYGHEAQKSMKKVDAWLKGIGYEIKD